MTSTQIMYDWLVSQVRWSSLSVKPMAQLQRLVRCTEMQWCWHCRPCADLHPAVLIQHTVFWNYWCQLATLQPEIHRQKIIQLRIYCWVCQRKNVDSRSIFGKIMDKRFAPPSLIQGVVSIRHKATLDGGAKFNFTKSNKRLKISSINYSWPVLTVCDGYCRRSVLCPSRGHISKTKQDRPIVTVEHY